MFTNYWLTACSSLPRKKCGYSVYPRNKKGHGNFIKKGHFKRALSDQKGHSKRALSDQKGHINFAIKCGSLGLFLHATLL